MTSAYIPSISSYIILCTQIYLGCKPNLELEKYHLFFTKRSQSINGIDIGILYFPLILPPAFFPSLPKDIKQLLNWHNIKQGIFK